MTKEKQAGNPTLDIYISKTRVNSESIFRIQFALPLPAGRRVQRINDELGKGLNLLLFGYFCCKRAESFEKLQFFTLG